MSIGRRITHSILSTAVITALGFSPVVGAMEFQPLGFESISMGGAGVASASGAMAGYYNPALLARKHYAAEFALSAGLGWREHNLANNIDTLSNINVQTSLDSLATNVLVPSNNVLVSSTSPTSLRDNITSAKTILSNMGTKKNGIAIMPGGALAAQIKNFGIGLYGVAEGTASAVIDPNRLGLIVKNGSSYYQYDPAINAYSITTAAGYAAGALDYALKNDLTYLQIQGLALTELPLSYAHGFETALGEIALGGSVKFMSANTYRAHIKIDTGSNDVGSAITTNSKSGSSYGLDVGVLFTPKAMNNVAVGVVAKNLNTPKFSTATAGTDYEIKPMLRAGVSVTGWKMVDVALDADLTKNKTFLPGIDSQYLGGGVNFHPLSWFSLRVGAMQNLASSIEGPVLTAGMGFGLKWAQLDFAAQASTKKGSLDGNDIPSYLRLNVALVSRW